MVPNQGVDYAGQGVFEMGQRMNTAEVAKVIADIDRVIAGEPSSGALATLQEARNAIRILSRPAPTARECLDDPALQATGMRTDTYEDEDGDKGMRLAMYRGAESNILAWFIFPVTEVYELAAKLLKVYDNLEGIK
jgi:hypothetical protein